MTEDNTKNRDRESAKNDAAAPEDSSRPGDASAETITDSADKKADDVESSTPETPAAQEGERIEGPSETTAVGEKISEETQAVEDFDLNLLLDIPLEITVELGRSRIKIQELLQLGPGSTVTLSKLEGEPVDILANDKLIARGKVVLQNKKYGIRITEITSRMNRIKSLH